MEVSFCFMKTLGRDADHCQEGFLAICQCAPRGHKSPFSRHGSMCDTLRTLDKEWLTCAFKEWSQRLRKSQGIPPCEIIIFYCGNVTQHIQWWLLTWHISRSDFLAQEQPCFIHRALRTARCGLPPLRARLCRFSARRQSSTSISDSRSIRKRARLAALRPRTAGTGRCTNAPLTQICHLFPAAVRLSVPCPEA
jgi:hypothetical protein